MVKPQTNSSHKLLDDTFHISILIKGADGLLEVLGGLLLWLIPTSVLSGWAHTLTLHELSHDPNDYIASHILHSAQVLTNGGKLFAVLYLLLHGFVKVGLVWALLKDKLWAYPLSLLFLYTFILYQVYRIGFDHSISLTLLTIFDLFVGWLIWREWRLRRIVIMKKNEESQA